MTNALFDFFKYFLISIVNFILGFFDLEILKYYFIRLVLIIIAYLITGWIYCKIFKISYIKYLKNTIFPIIGFIILIIQGIIYIFFIPYKLFEVFNKTFNYAINIIKFIFKWILEFINIIFSIETYILNI